MVYNFQVFPHVIWASIFQFVLSPTNIKDGSPSSSSYLEHIQMCM